MESIPVLLILKPNLKKVHILERNVAIMACATIRLEQGDALMNKNTLSCDVLNLSVGKGDWDLAFQNTTPNSVITKI